MTDLIRASLCACASHLHRATQQAAQARRGGGKAANKGLLVSHGEVTEADVARVISAWTGGRCARLLVPACLTSIVRPWACMCANL